MAELLFLVIGCIIVWPFVNGPRRPPEEKEAERRMNEWANDREAIRRAIRRYWW